MAEWITRTATGLQAAPVVACLLLVAGAGLGSIGGFEFSQRQWIRSVTEKVPQPVTDAEAKPTPVELPMSLKSGLTLSDVASVSEIVRQPNSDRVEVSFNQVERRRMQGTLHDAPIRQLLMLASQNGSSPQVRDDSVSLLAAACRAGEGCEGKGVSGGAAGDDIRDVLMVALRYDRSAAVRQKALNGLQPYVGEDMRVRMPLLETLLNDPDAHVHSTAIVCWIGGSGNERPVLSIVALSDQNLHIRDASRLVLRRVYEIQ